MDLGAGLQCRAMPCNAVQCTRNANNSCNPNWSKRKAHLFSFLGVAQPHTHHSPILSLSSFFIVQQTNQYGGVHWSRNKELYYKHVDEYKKCTATVFQGCNLFVIWGMIVNKDYEGLCDNFVQYEEDESKRLSKPELAQLLKERLRCTTWSY